jgi:hypothetical protein
MKTRVDSLSAYKIKVLVILKCILGGGELCKKLHQRGRQSSQQVGPRGVKTPTSQGIDLKWKKMNFAIL